MSSISCIRIGVILGRKEARAHPFQGVEEQVATLSGCRCLGGISLLFFMWDDERIGRQFVSRPGD